MPVIIVISKLQTEMMSANFYISPKENTWKRLGILFLGLPRLYVHNIDILFLWEISPLPLETNHLMIPCSDKIYKSWSGEDSHEKAALKQKEATATLRSSATADQNTVKCIVQSSISLNTDRHEI